MFSFATPRTYEILKLKKRPPWLEFQGFRYSEDGVDFELSIFRSLR